MSEPLEEKKPDYAGFKAFYDKHPDLDNSEYYAEFPKGNKSTIRSWKNRAAYIPTADPTPPTQSTSTEEFSAMESEYIKVLMAQTKSIETEFDGVDNKSKLLILRNRLRAQNEATPPIKTRSNNSSILPSPKPIGQNKKKFGIDKYIVFDTNLNEIRMEIPMDTVMDPEKNKELRSQ